MSNEMTGIRNALDIHPISFPLDETNDDWFELCSVPLLKNRI